MTKLLVIATHPIQYQAPWFRQIAASEALSLTVLYLWNTTEGGGYYDRGFQQDVQWDTNLLNGYQSEFLPNLAKDPGTHHFFGLHNPDLVARVLQIAPDCILCLGYQYLSFLRLLFSVPCRSIPKIIRGDSHLLATRSAQPFKKLLLSSLFKRFTAALYVGKANIEYFKLYGFQEKQLFFCPHAIDHTLFPTAQSSQDSTLLKLFFIGKLEPKKCPMQLLEAFCAAKLPKAELHFVGRGPLERDLKAAAAGDKSIVFHGFLNQSEMAVAYSSASAIILPSSGPYETWGLVVQEAAAVGVPAIVSSHVGSALDLIEHGKTGFCFPANEWQSLVQTLHEVSNKRASLSVIGRNAQKHCAQYSFEVATQGLTAAVTYCLGA